MTLCNMTIGPMCSLCNVTHICDNNISVSPLETNVVLYNFVLFG